MRCCSSSSGADRGYRAGYAGGRLFPPGFDDVWAESTAAAAASASDGMDQRHRLARPHPCTHGQDAAEADA